jgi:hypothetical protein
MQNNPYDPYDFYNEPTVAWIPQQQQSVQGGPKEEPFYEYPGYYAQSGYYTATTQQQAAPVCEQQAQSTDDKPTRMSKVETLEVADALKKILVVASIIGFGALSGLAASHVTGVTSSQAAPSSSSSVPATSPGSQSPSDSNSNADNSGGFFNSGNQGDQGGYQFGPGSSQSPFTGSHTS